MNHEPVREPPKLRRPRKSAAHLGEPPKAHFNFNVLKANLKKLFCCQAQKVDWNDRAGHRKMSRTIEQQQQSRRLSVKSDHQKRRLSGRKSIKASIQERKALEMIKDANNIDDLPNNGLQPDGLPSARNSRCSVNGAPPSSDKQMQRAFRKQTKMNTAKNLRRNSTIGEQMQLELRRMSMSQMRRGSRAEISPETWEKIQSLNIEKEQPEVTRSKITLAIEIADSNEGAVDESYDTYKIGVERSDDQIQNNNNQQTPSRTSIMKQKNESQTEMKTDRTNSVNSALLAATFSSKIKKAKERRSSIAFGDETTIHYDKHDTTYQRRGSFLHQQSRSILNIPVIEEAADGNEETPD